jgi:hypothetical protein
MTYRSTFLVLTFLTSTSMACSGDDGTPAAPDAAVIDPNNPLPPPHPSEGVQFAYDAIAPAGAEIWKCKIGSIPGVAGGGFLEFNRVESKQSAGMHHMDLAVLTQTELPDGEYDCDELYAAHPELMDEIIIYASQQETQMLQLPPGVVAEVPSAIKTMMEIHYVNVSDAEQPVFSRVNAYWIPASEVTQTIWGGAVRDRNLNIPAGGMSDEATRCEMTEDVDVLILSTHTHALAVRTEVYAWDGQARGELLYTNTDWSSPLLMDLTAAPRRVPKGQGFELHCVYDNPGPTDVHWGFAAADEMCNLALVYVPGTSTIECKPVWTHDGLGVDPVGP